MHSVALNLAPPSPLPSPHTHLRLNDLTLSARYQCSRLWWQSMTKRVWCMQGYQEQGIVASSCSCCFVVVVVVWW